MTIWWAFLMRSIPVSHPIPHSITDWLTYWLAHWLTDSHTRWILLPSGCHVIMIRKNLRQSLQSFPLLAFQLCRHFYLLLLLSSPPHILLTNKQSRCLFGASFDTSCCLFWRQMRPWKRRRKRQHQQSVALYFASRCSFRRLLWHLLRSSSLFWVAYVLKPPQFLQ